MQATKSKRFADIGRAAYRNNPWPWFRIIPIPDKKHVFAIESVKFPGHYVQDPGKNGPNGFQLQQAENILNLPADN